MKVRKQRNYYRERRGILKGLNVECKHLLFNKIKKEKWYSVVNTKHTLAMCLMTFLQESENNQTKRNSECLWGKQRFPFFPSPKKWTIVFVILQSDQLALN